MTTQQIGKVWAVISALLLYYALNSWIVSQGGNEIFGAKLVISNRIPAAMIAIAICSILLAITSLIGRTYALRAGASWPERIPLVGFESIDTKSPEGKLYQGAFLALFSLLPAISLIHFWWQFSNAHVVTTKDPPQHIESVWSWSGLTSWSDPARICTNYSEGPTLTCTGDASILPGFEPTVFAILSSLAILAIMLHWLSVFVRKT
jgi:hypothetical protein